MASREPPMAAASGKPGAMGSCVAGRSAGSISTRVLPSRVRRVSGRIRLRACAHSSIQIGRGEEIGRRALLDLAASAEDAA